MRNYIVLSTICLILTGCQNETRGIESSYLSPIVHEVVGDISTQPEEHFVEYTLCKLGQGYTDERMQVLLADWNQINASQENSVAVAFGLLPKFKTEKFDAIWINIWTGIGTHTAGWAGWNKKQVEVFEEKHGGIFKCDLHKAYLFEAKTVMPSSEFWSSKPPYKADYEFCAFNKDVNEADVVKVSSLRSVWLADYGVSKVDNGIWITDLSPAFYSNYDSDTFSEFDFASQSLLRESGAEEISFLAWTAIKNETNIKGESIITCQNLSFDLYPFLNGILRPNL